MPRLRHKRLGRREWSDDHRIQLQTGWDLFNGAWGDPVRLNLQDEQADAWPPKDIEADMRAAWADLREEIMAGYIDGLTRPWAWWKFDIGLPLWAEFGSFRDDQAETLDAMGGLTPAALSAGANDHLVARVFHNAAYNPAFRRVWGWWRFVSPERRDYSVPEAAQLVAIDRRGGEVLTVRERYVIANKADDPSYARNCPRVFLTRDECRALELPTTFEDEDETEIAADKLERLKMLMRRRRPRK